MQWQAVLGKVKNVPAKVKQLLLEAWQADRKSFMLAGVAFAALLISLLLYLQLQEEQGARRVYLIPPDHGILSNDSAVPPDSPLASGVKAWQAGYPFRATEAFKKALKQVQQRSLRAHICNYLGHIQLYRENYAAAGKWYRLALQEQADNAGAYYGAGAAAWYSRRFQEARRKFLQAHKLNPRFIQPLFFLGQVMTALRDPAGAATWYIKLLQVRNIPLVQYLAGVALQRAGETAKAKTRLEMVSDTSSVPVLLAYQRARLGDLAAAAGQTAQGVADYKRALELHPKHAVFKYNYAVLLLRSGKIDDAVTVFRDLVRSGSTAQPAVARTIGEIYYDKQQYGQAVGWMKRAVRRKGNPELFAVLGDLYFLKKQYDEAVTWYSKVYKSQPRTRLARFTLINAANALVVQRRFKEARELYRRVVRNFKPDGALLYNIGLSWFREKRWEKAADWFRRSFALENTRFASLHAAAEALRRQNDYRAALNLYRNVISEQRILPAPVYAAAGRTGLQGGFYREALKYYRLAVRLAAAEDSAYRWLEDIARIHIKQKNYPAAHRALAGAGSLEPGSAENRLLYGILLLRQSRFGEAEQAFRDGLTMRTGKRLTAEFYYRLGWFRYREKQYSAALKLFKRTLDLDPHHLRASGLAASCVDRLGTAGN